MDDLVSKTVEFVKQKLQGAEAGHDWFHIERVWKLSIKLAEKESVNLEVIHLGALLHDIADPKFHDGNEKIGPETACSFLQSQQVEPEVIQQVVFIIRNISFKNRTETAKHKPIELQIVQDADRLDAMGAIGIARLFNFGGFKNNPIHIPEEKPRLNFCKEEYKKSKGTSINHFYEKLLLLKSMMNTPTGKEMAAIRHQYMEDFLQQFYNEWNVVV
ncbi:HD domain-containing protein [Elizabethkingia argentiflava]|uniref:HD domain-containing protein n=1 Tax=Elizabethkingia argenteiflava TaxID=2681556 RepID=A0A845PSU1_9FLAO|nr:HD domain-containing protein [Elizabethkingia argenteiflava]NAW51319.1 HD domain-containing protein [Elizabethkingia argenteiflava]